MRRAILIVFAIAIILPSTAFAEKLGDITSYTGEVLIRNKGEWNKIENVPHPVFSSDKVVTKRGRAEIRFVDGGLIRMHIDSILSTVMKKEQATSRIVKVLVGDIWFNVRVKKGQSFKFRTPSMTAAIRGTSGPIKHTLDGQSSIGFRTGKGDVTGNYTAVPIGEMRPYASRLVSEPIEKVPLSDPKIRTSNIMQSVDNANNLWFKARLAASRASENIEAAKAAGDQAAKSKSDRSRINAAKAFVKAAASKSRAQLQLLKAQIATVEDALLEAKTFSDAEAIEAAEQNLRISKQALGKAENMLNDLQELENQSAEADTVLEAKAIATLIQAKSSAAMGNVSVVSAATQLAITMVSGDEEAARIAQNQLQMTEQAMQKTEVQVNKVIWLIGKMEGETHNQAAFLLIAAEAIADAATLNAANAGAQVAVAVEETAGDTASLEAAKARAKEILQLTITVNLVVGELENAMAEGNAEALMDSVNAIYDGTKTITGKVVSPSLVEPPVLEPSDVPRLPAPNPLPPTESEDLPSSVTPVL